jgi:predicted metal-binding membrane protein
MLRTDPNLVATAPTPGSSSRTRDGAATAAVLGATLALAAASWVVAVRRMHGMDMGEATPLGPFGTFVELWAWMMAAMMLPLAIPAALRSTRADRRLFAWPLFVGSYLAVWTLVGVALYAVYRPHGPGVAGAVVIAAGVYELTPLKRRFRRRCQARAGSGLELGLCCVGSGIGLMLVLVVLGVMSVGWMIVITVVALAQRLLPPRARIDVPVALATIGLGIVVITAPSLVPGLLPSM